MRDGVLPPDARDFGTWFGHFPPFIPFAIIMLPFLLGFRLTCYYYRKAYYRVVLALAAGLRGGRAARAATPARPASR